jgi:SAM-dependent methyltransferase
MTETECVLEVDKRPGHSGDPALWNFYRSEKEVAKSRRRAERWLSPTIRRLTKPSAATRVLCVGCGNGLDVQVLREQGYVAYGVDLDPHCHASLRGTAFAQADACNLPLPSAAFDVTVSLEVIEHIGTPPGCWKPSPKVHAKREEYVHELARVTKTSGVIILATPNRLFPFDEHGKGNTQIRWHWPLCDLTLTYPQLRQMFQKHCCRIGVVDYGEYFALEKIERLAGVKVVNCIRLLFPFLSNPVVHASPLNPHLFVYFRKA